MCGRGACTYSADRCSRVAGGARFRNAHRLRPKYNLGPQSFVPVVKSCRGGGPVAGKRLEEATQKQQVQQLPNDASALDLEVAAMKWGLVPAFAKRPEDYDVFRGGSSTFNARVEGLESSGLWRRLLDCQRGVVLLDGFYEWKTSGKAKMPVFIRHPDNFSGHFIARQGAEAESSGLQPSASQPAAPVLPVASSQPGSQSSQPSGGETSAAGADGPRHAPLMMAALFDVWRPGKEGNAVDGSGEGLDSPEPLETVTIITMDSVGTLMADVHDRMPVFLTPETAATWLDTSVSFSAAINPVLKEAMAIAKQLLIYEVSTLVSNVKNESPDCILSKKECDARNFSRGLGKFFAKKAPAATTATAPSAEEKRSPPPVEKAARGQPGTGDERPCKSARTGAASADSATAQPPVIELDDD